MSALLKRMSKRLYISVKGLRNDLEICISKRYGKRFETTLTLSQINYFDRDTLFVSRKNGVRADATRSDNATQRFIKVKCYGIRQTTQLERHNASPKIYGLLKKDTA